ncbi:hypothetical protein M436DRAFT_60767 [Aureobasidium namibiae CBS 147.97]|uniref:Mid2 domain-containing protein n=1 Tax=Aureobasidium namibiae CBS 147.97 TaxID=1043004 RepID=A0A074WUW5_9PEZI
MFISGWLFSILLIAQLFLSGSAQTCYWPDNSVAETLTPCNSAATNSHCCGPYALCLDNGYCFNQGNEYGNRLSRSGCTDKTWNSDACPKYCQTFVPNGAISISIISESGTGLFCCGMGWNATSGLCLSESGSGNFNPFSIGIGVVVLDRTTGATTLNISTAETTASENPESNSTSATTSKPDNDDHTTNTTLTAIGSGVAVSAGILLICAAVVFLWRLGKRRAHVSFQKFDSKNSNPPTPYSLASSYTPPTPQKYTEHVELEHSPRHFQGLGIQELEGHR